MSEAAEPVAERRSGRRKRRRKQETGWQSADTSRMILIAVTLLLLAALAYTAHLMRLASLMTGPIMIDAPREEVVYLRGQPAIRRDGDAVWQYNEGEGVRTTILFDSAGKVTTVSCTGADKGSLGCPDVMGIGMGTDEDTMLNRLGPPTRQNYIPGGKLMYYADLGVTFSMLEYRVSGTTRVKRSGKLDFLPRVFWHLLP